MSSPSSPPDSGPVNPWLRFWTAPAPTLMNMLAFNQGDAWALPLLFGGGLLSSLAPQVRELLAASLPQGTNVMSVAVIGGVVLGIVQALIWPPLLALASRWLGGQGHLRATRLAAAWSSLPLLLSSLLAPLGGSSLTPTAGTAFYGLFNLLLSFWAVALLVLSLSAAQRLSLGRAALSALIGGVLFVVVLILAGVAASLVLVSLGVSPGSLPAVP